MKDMLAWIGRCWLAWSLSVAACLAAVAENPTVDNKQTDSSATDAPKELFFEKDIRPILRAYCLDCHGAETELKGGLDLRQKRLAEQGGDSGASLVPGHPETSLMLQRIESREMPPGEKKLTATEVATIRMWISSGAKNLREEPTDIGEGLGITEEEKSFWSFHPLTSPTVPNSASTGSLATAIDAFVQQRLAEAGLSLSNRAERRALIRRATLDLTGLLPSTVEVEQFVQDTSPDAYERLLDRLLQSPRYGERWGRHWLDIAGFAESDGAGNADVKRPYAYKYRDYVVRSLNENKPWNQFLIEQLAGDELAGEKKGEWTAEQIELLTATGYLRMAADASSAGAADPELAKNQTIADTLKILGTGLLGLSVQCAQCHDHRYDPISQKDYHRLRAIIEPALDWKNWRNPSQRLISLATEADRAKWAEIDKEIAKVAEERTAKENEFIRRTFEKEVEKQPEALRQAFRDAFFAAPPSRTPEQQKLLADNPSLNITPGVLYQYDQAAADELKKYSAQIDALAAQKPKEDFIAVLNEVPGTLPPTFVFHRGDHRQPTKQVPPGDLSVICQNETVTGIVEDDPNLPSSGRRLAYAKWLTHGRHPLFGRVMVNRIWFQHFGQAIVESLADFGKLGNTPTHPELLDLLAIEWADHGWDMKWLHKQIMLSDTYQQSSAIRADAMQVDALNQFYWRHKVKRIEGEILRDCILQASGNLDQRMYGHSVGVVEDDVGQVVASEAMPRRSIYLEVLRSKPISFLTAFDTPVMETNCDRRAVSTVAPQALMLLNSDFILKQSEKMSQRLISEAASTPTANGQLDIDGSAAKLPDGGKNLLIQAIGAWPIAYQRNITPEELSLLTEYLRVQWQNYVTTGNTENVQTKLLTNLCQSILSSHEFIYVE